MPMKYPYRRTPVYRDLVPVHPGFSFRAMNQTPQKPEWKYIDTYSLTAPIVPNYGAAIWVLLNSCVAGSGVNQRIGKKHKCTLFGSTLCNAGCNSYCA